jgi:hypothetical protein
MKRNIIVWKKKDGHKIPKLYLITIHLGLVFLFLPHKKVLRGGTDAYVKGMTEM